MYLWVKSLHIIAVISWMAGMLYLPRLMVYHCKAEEGSELSETLKIMEGRLYRIIMGPAMMASWLFGLLLVWIVSSGGSVGLWLYMKMALVIGMTGVHVFLGSQVKAFKADSNRRSERFFRILNEGPTLLMVAIVVLVIVKPF